MNVERPVKLGYPRRLYIETFHGCNARCSICSVGRWSRPHGEMPQAVFETVVEQTRAFRDHLVVVSLYSSGEPLMGRRIAERVAFCKNAGLPNVGFSTNGMLLDEDTSRRLLDAGLDWITVSVDSPVKKTFEDIRIRLDFERVLGNVLDHIERRDRTGSSSKINLRFIEQDANRHQFEEFLAFWSRRLSEAIGDEVQRQPVNNWTWERSLEAETLTTPCMRLFDQCLVNSDGSVPLCCSDYNTDYDFGNVLERPLLDIWTCARRRNIQDIHMAGKRDKLKLCVNCDIPELLPMMRDFPRRAKVAV